MPKYVPGNSKYKPEKYEHEINIVQHMQKTENTKEKNCDQNVLSEGGWM